MANDAYQELKRKYNVSPDRRGECHIDCPFCGKEAVKGQTHASFSKNGFHCFVCGASRSLAGLLAHVTGSEYRPAPAPIRTQRARNSKRPPRWYGMTRERWEIEYCRDQNHLNHVWRQYKDVSPSLIEAYSLGYGLLPSSRCRVDRLLLPIFNNDRLVNIRGRRIHPQDDHAKWLASGGWQLKNVPLFNVGNIPERRVVLVVENPVDAIMISKPESLLPLARRLFDGAWDDRAINELYPLDDPFYGVASLSVSYWLDSWTEALQATNPIRVVVFYDNDLPGNGGAWRRLDAVREWNKKHEGGAAKVPGSRGAMLANKLQEKGIDAVLFDWRDAPIKADIGDVLNKQL